MKFSHFLFHRDFEWKFFIIFFHWNLSGNIFVIFGGVEVDVRYESEQRVWSRLRAR